MTKEQSPLVVLGTGYTGHYLYALARLQERSVLTGSRNPDQHLRSVPSADRIEFDLSRSETWKNVPPGARVIWCFPATPLDRVIAFAEAVMCGTTRLIVMGSTSAYDLPPGSNEYPPPWIEESAPIDLTLPRVQGEEYLRLSHQAIVLRVAGIYGSGRHPLDWIRQGRVGPSRRYVNLIHVEDLAAICLLALERGRPGAIYNVSDGNPRRWIDICEEASRRWGVTCLSLTNDAHSGKRISIAKLQRDFSYTFRHPDLYEAFAGVESTLSNESSPDHR